MSDLLTDARETIADISSRRPGQTHYEGCRTEHVGCLLSELAAEIERLRGYRDEAEAEASIASLAALRLRLTDAEREAIAWAVSAAEDRQHPADDALRGLLERTLPQS